MTSTIGSIVMIIMFIVVVRILITFMSVAEERRWGCAARASMDTDGRPQFDGSCSRCHVRELVNGHMSPLEMLAVFLCGRRQCAGRLFR